MEIRGWVWLSLLAVPAFSQQTVFNVPSDEAVEKGSWFFQYQTSVRFWEPDRRWVQNYGIGYGITDRLEVDATLFNLDISQPSQTRGGVGLKYLLPLGSSDPNQAPADIVLGDMGIIGDGEHRFGNWAYAMLGVNIHGLQTRIFGGAFHGTTSLFGKNTAGFLGGFEQRVGEKWTVQADWLSGKQDLGYFVPGLAYAIRPHWRISAGYQLPNAGSNGFRGLVFQLTRS
jgi:hypothetical protein